MPDREDTTAKIIALLTKINQVDLEGDLSRDLVEINKMEMRDGEMLELVRKYLRHIELKVSDLKEQQQSDVNKEKEVEQWVGWLGELEDLEVSVERVMRETTELDLR